jgi:hypothetical protein
VAGADRFEWSTGAWDGGRGVDGAGAWGETAAVLSAAEPELRGRSGYGIATGRMLAEIGTDPVRLPVLDATDDVGPRAAAPDTAREAVYARRVTARPGMLARRSVRRLRRPTGHQRCTRARPLLRI